MSTPDQPRGPALPEDPPKHAAVRRQLAVSTASNYAGRVVVLAVWFGLTPLLVSRLGKTQYGLWGLVASVVAYGSLADLGIAGAIVKYVAEYRSSGDNETASELVATALWLYCAMGLVVLVVGAVVAPFAPDLINVGRSERGVASLLVFVTLAGVALQLPATAAAAFLAGLNRFDLVNVIGAGAMILLGATTAAVLLLGGDVVLVSAVAVPVTAISLAATVWMIRRVETDIRFGLRGARRAMARQVLGFGSAIFTISIASTVNLQSDEIVIGAALPVAAVGPYSVARRLSSLPTQLAYQLVEVILPVASRLDAEGDQHLLRELYVTATRVTTAVFVAIGAGLIVFAGPFLSAWLGHGYGNSADIVLLLTLAALFTAMTLPAIEVLQGMYRHRPLVIFSGIACLLNLGLSIALVGPLGVRGVAIATLVATGLEALGVLPYAARVLGVPQRALITRVVIPAAVPIAPMTGVLLLIHWTIAPASILTVALAGLAGAIVYGACYLLMPTADTERQFARRALDGVRARLRGPRARRDSG